jgi:hypothetical protein
MQDKEQLFKYYETIVAEVNKAGFKEQIKFSGEIKYLDYRVDREHAGFTLEAIAENKEAYDYLESRGLIRHDICYRCGENPITDKYHFIEVYNKTKLNICKNCHPQARNNSGCLLLLGLPIIISIVSWFVL